MVRIGERPRWICVCGHRMGEHISQVGDRAGACQHQTIPPVAVAGVTVCPCQEFVQRDPETLEQVAGW